MTRAIELRSDTFTRPTPSMRRAMYEAEVGDDVWNEDPTVHRLERRAAQLTGKEAALFVSSGTQGNLIGLLSHTRPGDEVILGAESHIFMYEAAGTAVVGGLQVRMLPQTGRGVLQPDRIRSAIRDPGDPHFPPTGCVALENTHNRCGGSVITPEEIAAVAAVAHEQGIPVHLDGARVFNAAVALSAPVSEVVRSVDSVTFCLSKGLGAPVGSLLCGSKAYIERAYRWRKLLGGAMRQVGILAAAGLVALEEGVDRLGEDHENARALAEGLAAIPGIDIDPRSVQTNIVVFDVAAIGTSPQAFVAGLMDRGVKLADVGGSRMRAVTSYEVNRNDIDVALQEIAELAVRATPALA